ncbi:hypothetical protein SprV_0301226100 [Sparganum proliferum]
MQKFGCPEQFTQMVRQLDDGMMARVMDNGAVSEAFAVTNGVKQGCVLAPTRTTPAAVSPSNSASSLTPTTNTDRTPEPPLPSSSSSSTASSYAVAVPASTIPTQISTATP